MKRMKKPVLILFSILWLLVTCNRPITFRTATPTGLPRPELWLVSPKTATTDAQALTSDSGSATEAPTTSPTRTPIPQPFRMIKLPNKQGMAGKSPR